MALRAPPKETKRPKPLRGMGRTRDGSAPTTIANHAVSIVPGGGAPVQRAKRASQAPIDRDRSAALRATADRGSRRIAYVDWSFGAIDLSQHGDEVDVQLEKGPVTSRSTAAVEKENALSVTRHGAKRLSTLVARRTAARVHFATPAAARALGDLDRGSSGGAGAETSPTSPTCHTATSHGRPTGSASRTCRMSAARASA